MLVNVNEGVLSVPDKFWTLASIIGGVRSAGTDTNVMTTLPCRLLLRPKEILLLIELLFLLVPPLPAPFDTRDAHPPVYPPPPPPSFPLFPPPPPNPPAESEFTFTAFK